MKKKTKADIIDSIMNDVRMGDIERATGPYHIDLMEEDVQSDAWEKFGRWNKKDLSEFLKKNKYK